MTSWFGQILWKFKNQTFERLKEKEQNNENLSTSVLQTGGFNKASALLFTDLSFFIKFSLSILVFTNIVDYLRLNSSWYNGRQRMYEVFWVLIISRVARRMVLYATLRKVTAREKTRCLSSTKLKRGNRLHE